ncbi:MAG: phosphatidate cytidylyltransferase [Beijerinckiaceae bacterium]
MNDLPAKTLPKSELTLRVLSGIVMAALAITSVVMGGWFFALFWGFAAVAVAFEWQRLVHHKAEVWPTAIACSAALLGTFAGFYGNFLLAAVIPFLAAVAGFLGPENNRRWAATGVLYASGLGLTMMLCRGAGYDGAVVIFWLFGVVWGTDTLAYFTGRALGGPKLWPAVSPKKTWSGAIGGLLGGVLIACIILMVAGVRLQWEHAALSIALSALTQAGDLFESSIKRRYDAKDAGSLIPGHGGVMDRLDGFIVAVIFAACVGALHSGLLNIPAGLLYWR